MKLVFRQGRSCVLPETALAVLVPVSDADPQEEGERLKGRSQNFKIIQCKCSSIILQRNLASVY